MPSLTQIESIPGTLHVRLAFHGRKELNVSLPTTDLVDHLSRIERLFDVTAANRQDPNTHRTVRSLLVQMVEQHLDGKVVVEPAKARAVFAYIVTWCMVNHYRDAEATRTSIERFLRDNGEVHIDLMTSASDQMMLTVSETGRVEQLRETLDATPHGSTIGIAVDEEGEAIVTANDRPSLH